MQYNCNIILYNTPSPQRRWGNWAARGPTRRRHRRRDARMPDGDQKGSDGQLDIPILAITIIWSSCRDSPDYVQKGSDGGLYSVRAMESYSEVFFVYKRCDFWEARTSAGVQKSDSMQLRFENQQNKPRLNAAPPPGDQRSSEAWGLLGAPCLGAPSLWVSVLV